MKRLSVPALVCALLVMSGLASAIIASAPASAQDMATAAMDTMSRTGRTAAEETEDEDDGELTYDDYTVKAYKLTFYGGWFSGGTFLDLPPIDGDRTYVEEGSDTIIGYDGEPLNLDPELYDAPIKEIEPGTSFGGKLGVYLSENFHIDLTGSYSQGRAITTVRDKSDQDNPFRVLVDEDDTFSVLMGGVSLIYDGNDFRIFGTRPFVGFGLGGVINSFEGLDDATGLYFRGVAGLNIDLTTNLSILGQYQLSTFSFSRPELEYGKQVTYSQAFLGLAYFFDVLPPEIRAAHEAGDR